MSQPPNDEAHSSRCIVRAAVLAADLCADLVYSLAAAQTFAGGLTAGCTPTTAVTHCPDHLFVNSSPLLRETIGELIVKGFEAESHQCEDDHGVGHARPIDCAAARTWLIDVLHTISARLESMGVQVRAVIIDPESGA